MAKSASPTLAAAEALEGHHHDSRSVVVPPVTTVTAGGPQIGIMEEFDDDDAILPQHILFGLSRAPTVEWECAACTFINRAGKSHCEVCGEP